MTVDVPKEAERLLAAAPDEFVAERDQLAQLRDEDRPEEAAVAPPSGKPSAVVFAVNRAARRPATRPRRGEGRTA